MDIKQNSWLMINNTVKKITIQDSTVLNCQIRLFNKKDTLFGIELLFHQDGDVFTTVIPLWEFYRHPTYSLIAIIYSLINLEVELQYQVRRKLQHPFFQISTFVFDDYVKNIFDKSDVYKNTQMNLKDCLDNNSHNLEYLNKLTKPNALINKDFTYHTIYDNYIRLSYLNNVPTRIVLCSDEGWFGIVEAVDFLTYPDKSLKDILLSSEGKTFHICNGVFYFNNEISRNKHTPNNFTKLFKDAINQKLDYNYNNMNDEVNNQIDKKGSKF